MLEGAKKCYCATCKQYFDVVPDVEQYNQIEMPTRCGATGSTKPCPGSKFQIAESVPGKAFESTVGTTIKRKERKRVLKLVIYFYIRTNA